MGSQNTFGQLMSCSITFKTISNDILLIILQLLLQLLKTVFTQRLLVNFTFNYKEMLINTPIILHLLKKNIFS